MLELLRPCKTASPLIRLGSRGDGGYVLNEQVLNESESLYNYGVGRNWQFEDDYFRATGKPVYMFDPTIDEAPYNFRKEGLSGARSATCDTFLNHHRGERCILKMDVEGAEYDFWEHTSSKQLENVLCIIMEIHKLHRLASRAERIIRNILENFMLLHLHGNNFGKQFEFEGHLLPVTLELTFIANYYPVIPNDYSYPIAGIDRPNNRKREDYVFTFLQSTR